MERIQPPDRPATGTPRKSRLAAAFFTALLLVMALTIWLSVENGSLTDDGIFIALAVTAIMGYAAVGAVVARRAPRNPIGWLLICVGFTFMLGAFTDEYLTYQVDRNHTSSFSFGVAVWLQTWIFVGISALPLILLLFPDGRPPTPRWRWVVWFIAICIGVTALASMLIPGPIDTGMALPTQPSNPTGVPALEPILDPLNAIASIGLLVGALASAVALVVRWRRGVGVERRQIRLLAVTVLLAAVLFATTVLTAELGGPALEDLSGVLFVATFAVLGIGVPIALGVAILRYRMYDLEVVIRKTVRFAVVAVMILLVAAAALLVAGGTLIGGIHSTEDSVAPIVLGVLVGVLIVPMWRVSRRIADRLVFGGRATPYEVLTEFSERMGESYATDDVLPRMAAILGNAVGAARADVWLGIGPARRRAAGWPDEDGPSSPAGESVPVSYQGDELGALSVVMPLNDPMDDAKRSLLHDLASQAGPVLHNVRLVEDLRESRRRIVAAQDDRARKLERDIHDGVQQQLVALAVKLRLADQLIDRDTARAHEAIASLHEEAGHALEDLRDLARGIYPPLLADQGLEAALSAQARKGVVPTTVDTDELGRYPREVESAVYFCTLEALNNAVKYAQATSVRVSLGQSNGQLTFSITDDGRGFDPDRTTYGTGLQGMRDRLDAVGGSLRVETAPDAGVRVTGTLPVRRVS
ncbi:MAG TPA: histidine kinase [Actinomycetota bacterium]|nr:histidine kinase [Actinomycetota bacterium]